MSSNRHERRLLCQGISDPPLTQGRIKEIFAELEAKGEIVRTGEMRPARDGTMQPVYVAK
jgi:hypothetical protein